MELGCSNFKVMVLMFHLFLIYSNASQSNGSNMIAGTVKFVDHFIQGPWIFINY